MALTAENLAVKYDIDRETVDKFALRSQQNWKKGLNFRSNFEFVFHWPSQHPCQVLLTLRISLLHITLLLSAT